MMGEFNAKDANFLWRQIGRIDGVIETLNRTEGEMPEYEEELDFDFDSYCNKFIPFVQEWANEVSERLYGYGVNSIKVTSVGYPKEYNYGTDWMNVEV